MPNDENTIVQTGAITAVNSTDDHSVGPGGRDNQELRTHLFVSIQFTNSAGVAATPGAGTYTIGIKTVVNPVTAETIPNGSLVDATAAQVNLSVDGPVTNFTVTTDSITTATHYRLRYTSHRN